MFSALIFGIKISCSHNTSLSQLFDNHIQPISCIESLSIRQPQDHLHLYYLLHSDEGKPRKASAMASVFAHKERERESIKILAPTIYFFKSHTKHTVEETSPLLPPPHRVIGINLAPSRQSYDTKSEREEMRESKRKERGDREI